MSNLCDFFNCGEGGGSSHIAAATGRLFYKSPFASNFYTNDISSTIYNFHINGAMYTHSKGIVNSFYYVPGNFVVYGGGYGWHQLGTDDYCGSEGGVHAYRFNDDSVSAEYFLYMSYVTARESRFWKFMGGMIQDSGTGQWYVIGGEIVETCNGNSSAGAVIFDLTGEKVRRASTSVQDKYQNLDIGYNTVQKTLVWKHDNVYKKATLTNGNLSISSATASDWSNIENSGSYYGDESALHKYDVSSFYIDISTRIMAATSPSVSEVLIRFSPTDNWITLLQQVSYTGFNNWRYLYCEKGVMIGTWTDAYHGWSAMIRFS